VLREVDSWLSLLTLGVRPFTATLRRSNNLHPLGSADHSVTILPSVRLRAEAKGIRIVHGICATVLINQDGEIVGSGPDVGPGTIRRGTDGQMYRCGEGGATWERMGGPGQGGKSDGQGNQLARVEEACRPTGVLPHGAGLVFDVSGVFDVLPGTGVAGAYEFGAGAFKGNGGARPGSFSGAGAFLGGPLLGYNLPGGWVHGNAVSGRGMSAGLGGFVTNANGANQTYGSFDIFQLGAFDFSFTLAFGDNGVWMLSVVPGTTLHPTFAHFQTYTFATAGTDGCSKN
jgi:hypothetical protein